MTSVQHGATSSLHAILYRESSDESTGSANCSRKDAEFWGTLLVSETHTPEACAAVLGLNLCDSACGRPNEDDYGVELCLPGLSGFGRVGEVISPRATLTWSRVESVKFFRKATAALSYSKEIIRSRRDLARTKVCAAFRPKSANEIDQAQLMKLFEHAVQVGAVVVVSSEEEVTWK